MSSRPDNVGHVILWTVVECGLGIIAGSMPMLRKLFKNLAKDESSYARATDDHDLVTIGRVRGKHHQIYDNDIQVTVVAGNDQDSARDDESTEEMIRVTREVEQTSTTRNHRV